MASAARKGSPAPAGAAAGARANRTVNVKLVLLGEAAVGKSSLVLRFTSNEFQENKEPTIGAAFLAQKCDIGDRTIKFEIWDTAGQERFHSLAPMYYRNAQAAIVAYDITNKESLVRAKSWVKELQRQASPNIIIALAGNKCDLASQRQVESEEAEAYATEAGLLFAETSAKDNIGVTELFHEIAAKVPTDVGNQRRSLALEPTANQPAASGGCSC